MSDTRPLSGLRILVTRPAQHAAAFAERLRQAGAEARLFPVIEIAEPLDTHSRDAAIGQLADYNLAIFISPTAVEKSVDYIGALPTCMSLVAIGTSTARTIRHHGGRLAFEADTFSSEDLLALPAMQAEAVASQKIVIFRGEGGRELLAESLRQRGARVDYADMYRRALPQVEHLQTGDLAQLDAICVTSNQGLEHLMLLCDDHAHLKQQPLFVPSQRCKALAQALGFGEIHRANNATDAAMLQALTRWAAQSPAAR